MRIVKIIERKDVILYLEKRNLLEQYKKVKIFFIKTFFFSEFQKEKAEKR